MAQNPTIIGITGESGVGKSTISEIISIFFGIKNTTIISTDDLHKWDRTSKNWETFTHLNPDANNLELGDIHLQDLANGKFIYRSVYNHKTGYFDPPIKIEPQKIIIIEGLHAFYSDFSKEMLDLKIFIDTDDELRTHWKIIRDTEERGYKYNLVLDTINKRKQDNNKIREAQINDANAVITIHPKKKIACLGDKNEEIDLGLSISFANQPIYNELFIFIKSYITDYNSFIKTSKLIGNDLDMCQNGGGNISTKISDEYMMIKSSGFCIKDVCKLNGYSVINYKGLLLEDKLSFDKCLESSPVLSRYKKPSMETGFHILLNKYVVHLHPIYLTLLLCLENSKEIIAKLYSNLDYNYVEYKAPGFDLFDRMKKLPNKGICFLENHGVIVSSNDLEEVIGLLYETNNISKEYIKKKNQFQAFDLSFVNFRKRDKFSFPDAAIFANDFTKTEISAAHNYIDVIGSKIGNIRYLSSDDIGYISSLEAEKYRKTL